MTEEVETSFWISFFVEAGIPPAASANYAIIFTDNRIQKHMLLDLNKEYLKDMGVNVLGDIIAILKHAKLYHEKVAREKVLASKGSTTVSVKKATEHLNELLLKEEPVKPVTAATSKPASTSVRAVLKPSPPKKLRVLKSEIEIVEKEEESPDEELEELKRKVIPPSKQPQQQTKKMSVVSVQPSNKKTSVFERLGDSSVTSTTPEAPDSSAAAAAKSSVFQRLGKSLKASETEEVKAPLKLQTVVSTQPVTKKAIAAKPVKAMPEVTLRMDMEEASKQSAKERLTLRIGAEKSKEMKRVVTNKSSAGAGGIILKTSLQRTVRPPTVVSQTIKPKTVAVKPRSTASSTKSSLGNRAGIKQRLGSVAKVSASASSVGSSVFKRLGTTRNQS